MSALRFVTENPEFYNWRLEIKSDWNRVNNQAIEHTRFVHDSRNIDKARPNEPESVNDYRKANQRRLTKSVVDKFKTKTSRIFRSSGLRINEGSISDTLKDYLESDPYLYLNQPTDLMTYFFDYIYNQSIDDPNAVEILLPWNPLNPDVSPLADPEDGGMNKNEHVQIKKIIVPSDDIAAFTPNVFAWLGGRISLEVSANDPTLYKWFWIVDKEWFYTYVPVRRDQDKIIYELREWYWHDTGVNDDKVLPVNILPGNLVFADDGSYAYQASILSAFFEYADEFVSRFTDSQAVWVTTSFPIHMMDEMACTSEGCYQGKVPNPDKTSIHKYIACSGCNGTGIMDRPSPYGVIVKKDKSGMDGGGGSSKPYELINPDVDVLKTTYEIPFDLLRKGEKQIGLDVLENSIESGVSRAMRFEDVKDKLGEISSKLVSYLELHLFFTECLLVENRSQRKIPQINTPVDFQLKSSVDLREDAENALPADRLEKNLAYYQNIYKNNQNLFKVYQVGFDYSPLLLSTWEEINDQFNMGVIDANDIIRRNNVIGFLRRMANDPKWIVKTNEQIFTELDSTFESSGLLKPEPIILTDDNGETTE